MNPAPRSMLGANANIEISRWLGGAMKHRGHAAADDDELQVGPFEPSQQLTEL